MCDQCGSGVSRAMLIWNRDTRNIPPPRRRPGSVGKYTTCCGGILGGEFEVTCQTCPTGPAPGESVSIPVVGPGPMLYLKVEVLESKEPPSHRGVRVLCLGHPLEWRMVCDEGETAAPEVIFQLQNCPLYGQGLFLQRRVPSFRGGEFPAYIDHGVFLSIPELGEDCS